MAAEAGAGAEIAEASEAAEASGAAEVERESLVLDEPGEAGEAGGESSEGGGGEHKGRKPSNRALMITIVLTTLVAALGGFMLNRASAASSNYGDVAQRLSLQGGADETSAYQQAENDYAQYLSLQSLEAKSTQEMLEAGWDQPEAQNWADQYKVATAQVAATQKMTPSDMSPNLPSGDPDPNFPEDFFAHRAAQGTVLEAESDGYNDASNQWGALVDSYTAILTMVAVALFLFGSAYVLHGRNRILFTIVGGALVVVGVAWGTGLVAVSQPGTPSSAAARDYANGVVAISAATTPAQDRTAIADFTAAIQARPDYALAYSERALAEVAIGSEGIGTGSISAVSPRWERASAADVLEAYQLGDTDATDISSIGWNYYDLWLLAGAKGSPPPGAVDFDQQAIALDPSNVEDWANLGLTELALGNYRLAALDYKTAITHLFFSCSDPARLSTCTGSQPESNQSDELSDFATGMQGLETLGATVKAQHSPALRHELVKMEGVLTYSLDEQEAMSGPVKLPFKIPSIAGIMSPNYVELDVGLPSNVSYDQMVKQPITVIWYERPLGTSQWNGVSQTVCAQVGGEYCSNYDPQYDVMQFKIKLLEQDDACFTDVQYRAELWVGGNLAGNVTLSPSANSDLDFITTDLSPAVDKGMNIGACVPSNWYQQPPEQASVTVGDTSQQISGPLSTAETSFTTANGSQGIYMLRLYPPRNYYTGGQKGLQDLVSEEAQSAVDFLEGPAPGLPEDFKIGAKFTPESLLGDSSSDTGLKDMMAGAYDSAKTGTVAEVYAGIVSTNQTVSGLAGQDQAVASDVYSDYAIAVAIVYGPPSLFLGKHPLATQVVNSWSLLNFG